MAEPRWRTLPVTPELPATTRKGYVAVDGIKIWYAVYGSGEPVIMLHGGLANSNYWGHQVPELAKSYQVIVMDSRGHGRSTRNADPFSYDRMASDVIALMDDLRVSKAAVIGWSDGAIIGLKLVIANPGRVSRLFAFAANSDPSGIYHLSDSRMFENYSQRTREEYEKLSPTPVEYDDFLEQMEKMWGSQPNITKSELRNLEHPIWVAAGDHDEIVRRTDTLFIAENIPGAGLLIQPEVSHFSHLQNPQEFTEDLFRFLRAH